MFLIFLIARFGDVLGLIYSNSDAAWAQVLIQNLAETPNRGLIKVGEAPHITTLWFLEITRRFPFRQLIWDVAPFVATLTGLAVTAWGCSKAAGRWAAGMTVLLGLTAGPAVLATTLPEGMRSHTWLANSLMAAVLVFWATRPENETIRVNIAVGLATGVFAGLTLASDPLFLITGLVPFVGAGILGWLKTRTSKQRAAALAAGGVAVVALLTAR
ncbi:MAG: hypothetical protein ACRDIU_11080, partial [Actinomycetota bacterium]